VGAAAHKEGLAAGVGVHADDGVEEVLFQDRRVVVELHLARRLHGGARVGLAARGDAVRLARRMVRLEPVQQVLHRGRERLEGRLGRREERVVGAALGHDVGSAEDGEGARLLHEGVVRVPVLAEDDGGRRLADNLEALWALGHCARRDGVRLDRAKLAPKGDLLGRVELVLVGEDEDAARVVRRLAQRLHVLLREVGGQVHVWQHRPEPGPAVCPVLEAMAALQQARAAQATRGSADQARAPKRPDAGSAERSAR